MLDKIFSIGLDLFAFVTPLSIAATNIVFFPLAAVWLFSGPRAWSKWPAVWGTPEKLFLVFLGISLGSAFCGLDLRHSLREIKNKDLYILIAIVLVALVRNPAKNKRLIKIFMVAGAMAAAWGLIQFVIGVNQTDKSNGVFLYLPPALAHWPRPILDLLSMIQGRVMGTRGHPLAYAECLLFNWAFAICFFIDSRDHTKYVWLGYLVLIGSALLVSLSRGAWIAAGVMLVLAMLTSLSKRTWLLVGVGFLFLTIFAAMPVLRNRAESILDRSHSSNKERLHMWHAGWVLWKTHPLLGIGPGNVKAVSADFQTPDEHVWGEWGHLHSTYVNFLAERGALGLLSYFVLMAAFGWELWMSRQKAALLSMLGFLIGGLTETSYNTAVVIMTFYFIVGLALAQARHGEASQP
jgi:O-antigen ligase